MGRHDGEIDNDSVDLTNSTLASLLDSDPETRPPNAYLTYIALRSPRCEGAGRGIIPVFSKHPRTSSVPPENMEKTEALGTLRAYNDEADGEWEDLVADIQRYLRQTEVRVSSLFPLFSHSFISLLILMRRATAHHHPPPHTCVASQPALTWSMHALLNGWLLQVTPTLPESLSPAPISPPVSSTHLVSSTGKNFMQACDSTVSPAQVLEAELASSKPHKADTPAYNPQTRTLGKHLCEIALVKRTLVGVGVGPSLLAAAGMWVALGTFICTWALARWDEGTKPDLVEDLAGLEAEIRLKLKHASAREGEAGRNASMGGE
ncbi:hypothetical protein B0H13DRAFT_2430678 [Mycena leptocephala]|nr:hypothetical protein B0H13DRAFT_2430678 [Mycena leptocephala]